MRQRYFIELAYNGKNYHGWQSQPNSITIQEVIEKCLSLQLREKIEIVGAGRTDTGVHAKFYVAHFDCNIDNLDSDNNYIYKINNFLPKDIAIFKIYKVKNDAHTRFDAKSRTYEYHITTKKDPFNNDFAVEYYDSLNIEAMNKAAELLYNYTDFTSFSKLHTDTMTNNCDVSLAKWEIINDKLIFTIKADRFLRNMVRAIVGTLLEIGKGRMTLDDFKTIIELKDRKKAGTSAPAKGLYLVDIEY